VRRLAHSRGNDCWGRLRRRVADKLNRVTPIEADKRRYRECLAREEAQRKQDAMLAEKCG